jgi:hypothetical protein
MCCALCLGYKLSLELKWGLFIMIVYLFVFIHGVIYNNEVLNSGCGNGRSCVITFAIVVKCGWRLNGTQSQLRWDCGENPDDIVQMAVVDLYLKS